MQPMLRIQLFRRVTFSSKLFLFRYKLTVEEEIYFQVKDVAKDTKGNKEKLFSTRLRCVFVAIDVETTQILDRDTR